MAEFDEDPDLIRMKERLEQDHKAAIAVWLNMLHRAAIDDVTWMRLGYSYLGLGEKYRAIAAFVISTLINPEGKGFRYLNPILKNINDISADMVDLYVFEWLDQFRLKDEYEQNYADFKLKYINCFEI